MPNPSELAREEERLAYRRSTKASIYHGTSPHRKVWDGKDSPIGSTVIQGDGSVWVRKREGWAATWRY